MSIFSSCISKKNEHFLKQRYAKTILNKSIFAEWPLCLFVMFYPSKLSAGGAKRDNPLSEGSAKDWLWTSDNDDDDGDENI